VPIGTRSEQLIYGRQDGIGLVQQPVVALLGHPLIFGCLLVRARVPLPQRAAHRSLLRFVAARREDPITDNASGTAARNASVNKAGDVGIMSIVLNLMVMLTSYPARDTAPPDTVSVLVAGPVLVGTNVLKVR